MADPMSDIIGRLKKRRARLRSWVDADSHPVVVEQIRGAHAALGVMCGILQEIAPALSRLLTDEVAKEQRAIELRKERKAFSAMKAQQLRAEAAEEGDPEQVALLEALARLHESILDIPEMSEIWEAGVHLTLNKLYRTADQVSRSRDAEAINTLSIKALATAGKWALKLTPVRREDLQDLKDVWDFLQGVKDPLDDFADTVEAAKLRKGQVKAASSLFGRLEILRELVGAWNQMAMKEPFLAKAIHGDWTTDDVADTKLAERLRGARAEWN